MEKDLGFHIVINTNPEYHNICEEVINHVIQIMATYPEESVFEIERRVLEEQNKFLTEAEENGFIIWDLEKNSYVLTSNGIGYLEHTTPENRVLLWRFLNNQFEVVSEEILINNNIDVENLPDKKIEINSNVTNEQELWNKFLHEIIFMGYENGMPVYIYQFKKDNKTNSISLNGNIALEDYFKNEYKNNLKATPCNENDYSNNTGVDFNRKQPEYIHNHSFSNLSQNENEISVAELLAMQNKIKNIPKNENTMKSSNRTANIKKPIIHIPSFNTNKITNRSKRNKNKSTSPESTTIIINLFDKVKQLEILDSTSLKTIKNLILRFKYERVNNILNDLLNKYNSLKNLYPKERICWGLCKEEKSIDGNYGEQVKSHFYTLKPMWKDKSCGGDILYNTYEELLIDLQSVYKNNVSKAMLILSHYYIDNQAYIYNDCPGKEYVLLYFLSKETTYDNVVTEYYEKQQEAIDVIFKQNLEYKAIVKRNTLEKEKPVQIFNVKKNENKEIENGKD